MTAISTSRVTWSAPSLPLLVVLLLALTVLRVIALHFSVVDLFFDEAQYWAWARELAFGYYSKPPLLAWIIAASEHVCGSGEACVRMASPLIYFATSLVVYAIADELYGKQAAFWSALAFALATGVSFSARIISTDVPLLFCWSVALLAYLKLLIGPTWRWTVIFGIALGFGMLAKYAMVYFSLCVLLAVFWDRAAREALWRPQTWVAIAIALLVLAPNIYWNFTNEFATLRHTGDNITGTGWSLRPLDALGFLGGQFAVMGPLVFAAFVVIVTYAIRDRVSREDKLMVAFALPPLLLVSVVAVFRGANANWAAPAAVSMTVLVVAWWLRFGGRHWLAASLAIAVVVQAAMLIGDAYADRISIAGLGSRSDLYQRTLGWRGLGDNVERLARESGARTIAAEGRPEVAALTYYLRGEPRSIVSWPREAEARSYFDMAQAIEETAAEPVLLITGCSSRRRLQRFYADVARLPELAVPSGPTSLRKYNVFKLSGRTQALGPLGPC